MAEQFDDFSALPPLPRQHLTTLEIFIGDLGDEVVSDGAVAAINALAKMIRLGCTGQSCEHCEPGHGCQRKPK